MTLRSTGEVVMLYVGPFKAYKQDAPYFEEVRRQRLIQEAGAQYNPKSDEVIAALASVGVAEFMEENSQGTLILSDQGVE